MKKRACVLLWALLLSFSGGAAMAQGMPAQLNLVLAERVEANRTGDVDAILRITTPDYFQTDISGIVQSREVWLAEYFRPLADLIHAGRFRWATFDQRIEAAHVYANCAIVMGTLNLEGAGAQRDPQHHTWVPNPDARISARIRFTQIYVRRHGRWLLAALHNAVPFRPT